MPDFEHDDPEVTGFHRNAFAQATEATSQKQGIASVAQVATLPDNWSKTDTAASGVHGDTPGLDEA